MWSPLAINLEYLAAYVEGDVDEILIVNQEFDDTPITKYLDSFKPDLLGVSMSATEHTSGLEMCTAAKKRGITTAIGGYHPTAIPDDLMANKQVDMVFRGESEITLKEFLAQGSPEGIAGITYRSNGSNIVNPDRPFIEDLDILPFPARHLRRGDECDRWTSRGGTHRDQIHASRGCWGRCTFCCEPSMSGSVQRYRSPDNVFKEIKEVYKYHDEKELLVLFGDPHLMGKPELVDQLCDKLLDENMDIIFTAMVRADTISKNPEVVAKMVKAGIVGYCMGIESPAVDDLDGTKKGISKKIQMDAVRTLRHNHAIAGGTFVIGLPGQTEEEIMMFPEYARYLGMTNAAFAIATPQAGTEFYDDLEKEGLIHNRDWTYYDQMHSVFKHDTISTERLEQLLTHCIGRFYAPDIFVDDIVDAQFRYDNGKKASLFGFFKFISNRFDFVANAGPEFRPDDGPVHGRIFLGAQLNPWTKLRTQKIGIHNVMDLEQFLKIVGDQKIQISVTDDSGPFIHYVLEFKDEKFQYVDILEKPLKDATLTLKVNLESLSMPPAEIVKDILGQIWKQRGFGVVLRLGMALAFDYLTTSRTGSNKMIQLPKEYYETGFPMDGWGNRDQLKK